MAKQTNSTKQDPQKKQSLPFTGINYVLVLVGIALLVVGFILMMGGGSTDPDVFNKEEIFSFRRITLSTILVLLGFVVEIVAIFVRKKNK